MEVCPWCGARKGDCDCQERMDCPHAGKPMHRQCGQCNCGEKPRPKFMCGKCQWKPEKEVWTIIFTKMGSDEKWVERFDEERWANIRFQELMENFDEMGLEECLYNKPGGIL